MDKNDTGQRDDAALSGTTIGFLRREAFELRFSEGDRILRRGEPGRALYVVLEGEVGVELEGARGERITLARLGEGGTFGEMSILLNAPVSADVVALCDVRVLAYPPNQLDRALEERPSLRKKLMRRMAGSLSSSTETAMDYFQRSQALSALAEDDDEPEWVAESGRMRSVLREVDRLAESDVSVVCVGERGTGRFSLLRRVHRASTRQEGPLIVLDCQRLRRGTVREVVFGADPSARDEEGLPQGLGAAHLAHGGTLILRHVEVLNTEDLEVLSGELKGLGRAGDDPYPDVRVLATGLPEAADRCAGNQGRPFERVLEMPALRERRRDIVPLARQFLEEASQEPTLRFDGSAERVLVTRSYRHRNVAELRDTVELGARCADNEEVRAEHLFEEASEGRLPPWIDLARVADLRPTLRGGWLTRLRWVVGLSFAAVIVAALAAPGTVVGRVANGVIWQAWEPAVFALFLLVGPVWCTVCPLSSGARGVQRLGTLGLRPWRWLRTAAPWLAAAGFLAILWLEVEYHMPGRPEASAWLLVGLLAAAVLCAAAFRREVWCRDLCPLGRLGAMLAAGAPLSVAARREVCASRCTSHECYQGTGDIPGCTVYHHPQQAADAHNCKLCLDCLRSCPHQAADLRLRPPLAGVWHAGDSSVRLAPFALGVTVLALLFLAVEEGLIGTTGWRLAAIGMVVVLVGGAASRLLAAVLEGPASARRIVGARLALSLGLLGWGALMVSQVGNLEALRHVRLVGGAADVSLVVVVQVVFAVVAAVFATVAVWRTVANGRREGVVPARGAGLGLAVVVVAYSAATLGAVVLGW